MSTILKSTKSLYIRLYIKNKRNPGSKDETFLYGIRLLFEGNDL